MTSGQERALRSGYLRSALAQLGGAIAALHAAGKIHCDIKPSNVLVSSQGRVVLLDFGMATSLEEDPGDEEQGVTGTIEYMAPEQAAAKRVGIEADMYALGVVMYQALTGCMPFAGTTYEVLVGKQRGAPPRPMELGVNVPLDLDELCMALLQVNPKARPTADAFLERLGVTNQQRKGAFVSAISFSQTPVFVGRETELREMLDALASVRKSRSPITLLIAGESGVGKSALMMRFLERLRISQDGLMVLNGRCYERESVPYKALDGIVDALARQLKRQPESLVAGLLPRWSALLTDVFPVLQRVSSFADAPRVHAKTASDPQTQRVRLFASMRELFIRVGDRYPLVVCIDDLQWADADSMALLGEMLRPPEGPAMLVIATLRKGAEVSAKGAWRDGKPVLSSELRVAELGRLAPSDAEELACLLTSRASDAVREKAGFIAAEAMGHPLFIHELVRHVTMRRGATGESLRLDDVIQARMEELAPAVRDVLELIAVAGTPVPQITVARAASMSLAEFSRRIASLRVAHLVQTAGSHGAEVVRVYHDRIRASLLAGLDSDRLQAHHRALAEAFEAADGADPERLVTHWEGAGDVEKAVHYSIRAAKLAEDALAFDHAAGLYQRALYLHVGAGRQRHDLMVKLADALARARRGREAADAYVLASSEAFGGPSIELERKAAEQYLCSGHVEQGLDVVQRVFRAVGLSYPKTAFQALVSVLLRRLLIRVRGLWFKERDPRGISPALLTRIDLCWAMAITLGQIDNIRGADFNGRTLLMALRAGDSFRLVRALAVEAVYSGTKGSPTRRRTERVLSIADALGERLKVPRASAWLQGVKGSTAYFVGEFSKAVEHTTAAIAIFEEQCTGVAWELATVRFYGVVSLIYLGRLAEISRLVPQYLSEATDRGDLYFATNLRLGMPNLAWLVRDDVDFARRMTQEALQSWSHAGFHIQHFYALVADVQLALYVGDSERGYKTVLATWPALVKSMNLRIQVLRITAFYLRARCALAMAFAGGERQASLLKEAQDGADKIRRERVAWANALAKLIYAAVYSCRGLRNESIGLLRDAITDFVAIDMELHAMVSRWCLGALLGDDEGEALITSARGWMTEQTVKRPERWVAMFAPGFKVDVELGAGGHE